MEQQEFDLTKRLKGVWRFKWIIALMVLVAGGTALGFTAMQPPIYEATATVMVESEQQMLDFTGGPTEVTLVQDIESQIEVMKSRSVLERAISQLEPEKATNPQYLQLEVEKLQNALKIQQARGTSLVAVTVVSSDPVVAQKQANAVAEAYVDYVNRTRLTTIEATLENTTKQLKELRTSEVDLSISPSLTKLTTRIDTALVALESVSEHLQQIGIEYTAASQLDTVSQQVDAATSEANQLYELVQVLALQPIDVAVIESRTRALATKLSVLSTQVEAIQQMEIGTQFHGELLEVEQLVEVASATEEAILEQVITLSGAISNESSMSKTNRNLKYRIIEHADLVVTTLEAASEQLQQITVPVTQWHLEVLNERAASATATLQALLQQLQPLAPEQGVILTQAELADMETSSWTVATTLKFLLSEVEEMQSIEAESQVYGEALSIEEWVTVASNAVADLPDEIASLAESGGSNLGYTELDNLRQELQLALLTNDSSEIRVVDTASVSPTTITTLEKYKNVILAVIAALLVGILGVLVFQYFDRRVRDASQAMSYVGLPLLARFINTPATGYLNHPSILNGSASQYLEAFRMLRTNLGLDSYQGQVLLVSSPDAKEGKTTVAANLARVVALQDRKVLLIDGNLRKPDVASAFGLAEAEGLADFLTSETKSKDYITRADGVDIIPAGTASEKGAEMLSSPRMKALLEKAKQTYDVVIVDSAPIMRYADTRILAKEVNEALLVLQPDASSLDLARDSRQALETMGVRVAGFALNKVVEA